MTKHMIILGAQATGKTIMARKIAEDYNLNNVIWAMLPSDFSYTVRKPYQKTADIVELVIADEVSSEDEFIFYLENGINSQNPRIILISNWVELSYITKNYPNITEHFEITQS